MQNGQVGNGRFTTVPFNPLFDKNVQDIIVFLSQKVFHFDNFSIASYKQDLRKSRLLRNHEWK